MTTESIVSPPLEDPELAQPKINPWLFVPVLYFMQAVPNILVTETFGTAYKKLEIDNMQIATWTGLAALPWAFKMFWGPLVDLSFTKRQWTLAMQVLISATLVIAAIVMRAPLFFPLTVGAMFLLATLSATHDIACDGLYLMSLDRKRQAAFTGVMATFSRFGRLFCASLLVTFAGFIAKHFGYEQRICWSIALGLCAIVYAGGMIWNTFALPRPEKDVPAVDVAPGERKRNIRRTLTIIAMGVAIYYLIAAILNLAGYAIFLHTAPGSVPAAWNLRPHGTPHTVDYFPTQFYRIGVTVILIPFLALLVRKQVSGTPMGDAFISYVKQPGFPAILTFIIFYRFGEAMIFSMAKLFILGKHAEGGMEVSLEQFGAIQGVGQVAGLIVGGLIGGWFISRVGLRRAFWPLVVGMHLPNILYIWAAYTRPDPNWLYPVVFCEAMGYGFGFAGYFVYLMHVAQRNKFVTSHYAIGTGFGALFITFAFITAGIVQSVFGYKGVFIAACLFTIPGTLTLLIIPMDDEKTKQIKVTETH